MPETTVRGMLQSLSHLLSFAWKYLLSALGTTTLSVILFSFFVPLIIFLAVKLCQGRKEEMKLKDVIRSFFSWQTFIPFFVTLVVWICLITWAITRTIYTEHEALKSRISILSQEKEKYKKEAENKGKEIDALKKVNLNTPPTKQKSVVVSTIPSTPPMPTFASIRIASQKQIVSTELPYGLEVVLQTDTTVEPVAFEIEFSGEIAKGQAFFSGPNNYFLSDSGIVKGHPNIFRFVWQSPAFTSAKPITVNVFSKSYVKAIGFHKIEFQFPLPLF